MSLSTGGLQGIIINVQIKNKCFMDEHSFIEHKIFNSLLL